MLEASLRRPGDATTIYKINVDTAILEQQMRNESQKLADGLDNGDITISVREPTQSLLAALILQADVYTDELGRSFGIVTDLAQAVGQRVSDVHIDMAARQIGINLEVYTTSISRSLTNYTVSNLPA